MSGIPTSVTARRWQYSWIGIGLGSLLMALASVAAAEDWPQLKYDARRSGNAADRNVAVPLGLAAAAPLGDAIFTAPVVGSGRVYIVDGSGTAYCLDATTLRVLWKVETRGGKRNCNNVCSPALAAGHLHFGTMAGVYYVIDAASGKIVKEIDCGEPILSAPAVGLDRVYFATLGGQIYALTPAGAICWTWDFVKERLGFSGDRWSGRQWRERLHGRVTNSEQFPCSRDIALDGRMLVIPAGGSLVWLEDTGPAAAVRKVHLQHTATFGLSIGPDGTVYRQWYWLDNTGQVDVLRLRETKPEEVIRRAAGASQLQFDEVIEKIVFRGKEGSIYVPGTKCDTGGGSLSFSSVSMRGGDVYRCRPEEGFGFCRHSWKQKTHAYPDCYPSIVAPVLLRDQAVYGGLDGKLYVVPLAGGKAWSFATAFAKPITAPAAACDGRIYFGCEDGYLYMLAAGGSAPLPEKDLRLWQIRNPLQGPLSDSRYDRYTSYADWANTNFNDQPVAPPFRLAWVRRYEGTTKHFSVCGGGRMYTHTAEGMIFAVEQETGRLLWRRFFPGVHISYTSPVYYHGRLLVPQAGLDVCRLRCLDAATGKLMWEAPFAGSPSWNRQQPPIVFNNLAFYAFGTGKYERAAPPGERVGWLFGHQNVQGFPPSHRPLARAYDFNTGKVVWTRDLSAYGCGGDEAGLCLMDGKLYYSNYFGRSAKFRNGTPGPKGITAALEPETGNVIWLTTKYSVHGGCTLSGKDGRLYLGGYNPLSGTEGRHVWCLRAADGTLAWQSDPLLEAIHVPTIGPDSVFIHAQYRNGYLLDKATGKIRTTLAKEYKCSQFTWAGSCLLGPAMDVIDVSDIHNIKLLSSGPRLDPSECTGAFMSNGRIFYTGGGAGLQACAVCGAEAAVPNSVRE
jgi:outer membrane protein assembly factor BamB